MHPILFRIGPFALRSYGLMLALSFFLGILWASHRVRKLGSETSRMIDLAVVMIIASVIGSRLFYVVFHWSEFSGRPLDIINPFSNPEGIGIAGLSMDGGVFLAVLCGLLFLRLTKQPPLITLDAIAPAFALGIFVTRIGCLLNGCCFGKPCSGALGIVFPSESLAGWYYPETPLHPTQIYNALGGLVMMALLLWLERYRTFKGYTFLLAVIFYGLLRLGVDFFRHFEENVIIFRAGSIALTANQVLSGLGMLIALFFFVWLNMRNRPRKSATAGR
jgi:phosphatidylglycerol:prolipoprotein diacylglycerol transferase